MFPGPPTCPRQKVLDATDRPNILDLARGLIGQNFPKVFMFMALFPSLSWKSPSRAQASCKGSLSQQENPNGRKGVLVGGQRGSQPHTRDSYYLLCASFLLCSVLEGGHNSGRLFSCTPFKNITARTSSNPNNITVILQNFCRINYSAVIACCPSVWEFYKNFSYNAVLCLITLQYCLRMNVAARLHYIMVSELLAYC